MLSDNLKGFHINDSWLLFYWALNKTLKGAAQEVRRMSSRRQDKDFRNWRASLHKSKVLEQLRASLFATILGVLLVSLVVTGCLQGTGGEVEIQVTVSPNPAVVTVGEKVELSASSTNSQDEFTWISDNNAIAAVDST
jgi:hypothetical protein